MGPVLVNGPGSMAWFKMEKLEKRNSQSEAPSDDSYTPSNSEGQQAKDFFSYIDARGRVPLSARRKTNLQLVVEAYAAAREFRWR